MVKFEGKNLGEKVEDKILGKILVQKYWLQKMNTSFVHQVLWLKFCAEKVEDKIWGKILVQKCWLQKMNKSFVHQSKAQVLWLKFCGCCRKIFDILHLTNPFKKISTQRMKITIIPQYTTEVPPSRSTWGMRCLLVGVCEVWGAS